MCKKIYINNTAKTIKIMKYKICNTRYQKYGSIQNLLKYKNLNVKTHLNKI